MKRDLWLISSVYLFITGCAAAEVPQGDPNECLSPRPLAAAVTALKTPTEPCRAWLRSNVGRAGQSGFASGAIWSTGTKAQTGVFVSAVHTLGEGQFGMPGQDVPEALIDPSALFPNGSPMSLNRVRLVSETADLKPFITPLFLMFHPSIPGPQTLNGLAGIQPRHDFYVAAIDGQALALDTTTGAKRLGSVPLVLFDPDDPARRSPTFAAASPGEPVLVIGVPRTGPLEGTLAFSIGRILNDGEARTAIADLAALGDEEGTHAYDAEAELLFEGSALPGMSGSGLFNTHSQLVGVLVRGSEVHGERQYVRAVRMTYLVGRLQAAYEALSPSSQAQVSPFLETASH